MSFNEWEETLLAMISKLYQDNSRCQPREGSKEEERRRYIPFKKSEREGKSSKTDSWILLKSDATSWEG